MTAPPTPSGRGVALRLASAGLVTLATACGAARAQSPAGATVPLCFTDFAPYVSTELPEGGSLGALAKRAFTAAGLTVQIIRAPWARAFTMASHGECLLLALWRDEERDALFRYSLPVAEMQLGLFVRSGQTQPPPAHAPVAYQRGSYLPAALQRAQYQLSPVADLRAAVQMLALERVDAVFSERASLESTLSTQPALAGRVHWLEPALETKTAYMAIARQHPQADAWLAILNQAIRPPRGH